MDENQNDKKQNNVKVISKKIGVIVLIVCLWFLLVGFCYTQYKDDYDKLSEKNSTYSTMINQSGQVVYIKTNEDGTTEEVSPEDMVQDFKEILEGYIDCDNEEEFNEKVKYLINAEAVTKLPYIESLDGDDSTLNGTIKFCRYTNKIEAEDAATQNSGETETDGNTINPKEIFYIGDSWIVGLNDYIKYNVSSEYPGQDHFLCREGLGARNSKFSNDNLKKEINDVESKVSAIVIMLGLNDTSEAAANRMNEIIDFLISTYPDKVIYVLRVPHVGETYKSGDIDADTLNGMIDSYNSIVSEHCSEIANVRYIDVTSEMMTEDLFLNSEYSDGSYHLNDKGKALWYENIKECIGTGKTSSSTTKYQLTYISPEEFEQQKQNYASSGNQEIFKHFTIDDEGQVLIAYGTKETRTISVEDADITEEMVREASGEESYTGNYQNGFSMVRYTISEKPIDYLSLVEQYVMPTNLLYAFLIQTGEIDFVEAIAELAYESEIVIGIYDNDSVSKSEETVTYNKTMVIDERITLNFNEMQTTNPSITKSKLYSSPYSYIPNNCYTSTNVKQHILQYLNPGNSPKVSNFTADTYISETNSSGKITSLSDVNAKTFTAAYQKIITSNSVSTYGVVTADTWIARWRATYINENCEPTYSSSSGSYEDETIIKYETKDDVLNVLEGTIKSDTETKLNDHAQDLKTSAIERIVKQSVSLLSTANITISDLEEETKKEILEKHINKCSTCSNYIDSWWESKNSSTPTPTPKPGGPERVEELSADDSSAEVIQLSSTVVGKITGTITLTTDIIYYHVNSGDLKGTIVETDYLAALQNYVDERNNSTEEIFKKELEDSITYTQSVTGYKEYKNIAFTSSYTRESTKYEKSEETDMDKVEEKFPAILKDRKFYYAKKELLENIEWFWEYIRANEDTAKLEDVLRYLLNIATDSEDYGEFDADKLKDLFKAFEPKEKMDSASNQGLKLLREYIRTWENAALLNYINGETGYNSTVAKYINEEKTEYYIRDDGVGHPTVGFGIDIFNGGFVEDFLEMGYTESQLRDISGAVSVPVEFVDSLEDKEIQEKLSTIRERTSGLELESYQLYALVSRAYNCGTSGAMDGYTGIDFVTAYTKYFNPETDLKYGETQGDFEHSLYTEFMYSPTKSDGKELAGLIRRRKSEWTLFQTGYMDTLEKWASQSGTIIDCAEEIHAYMEEYEYTYCVYFCNGAEECSSSSQCGLNSTFEKSKTGYHHTCCATFVSWVLQEAGYFTEADHTNGADAMKNKLIQKGWQQIGSIDEAEPGDVLYYSSGHVEIYAGDGTVYNAGSGSAIRRASPYKKTNVSEADMIFRAP